MSMADFSGVLMAIGLIGSAAGIVVSLILIACKLIGIFAIAWTSAFLPTLIPMAFLGLSSIIYFAQFEVPF